MAVQCPNCKRGYDATLFAFGKTVTCDCGKIVRFQHKVTMLEDMKILEIKRLADKISFLIVSTDYPDIDIEREKNRLKEVIDRSFPDKSHLYELIYEPRFRRLKEHFRDVL
jgi:hypothetical protein